MIKHMPSFIILACFVFVLWIGFYPLPIFELTNGIQPLKSNIEVGENLLYRFEYCKYKDVKAEISKNLYKVEDPFSESWNLQGAASNLKEGCGVVSEVTTELPSQLTPGEYRLDVTITYHPYRVFLVPEVYEVYFNVVDNIVE